MSRSLSQRIKIITNGFFIKQKDKDAYLKVDTAYTNETGTKFLAYGWTEKAKDKADLQFY